MEYKGVQIIVQQQSKPPVVLDPPVADVWVAITKYGNASAGTQDDAVAAIKALIDQVIP